MYGTIIGKVLSSKSPKVKAGDIVLGNTGWTEYAITNDTEVSVINVPKGVKVTEALGGLGRPFLPQMLQPAT